MAGSRRNAGSVDVEGGVENVHGGQMRQVNLDGNARA